MAALRREFDGRPVIAIAGIAGIVGAIGIAIGFAVEPERAFAAYLAAWCACITICVGALAILGIGYATNARWPAVVRRLCEAVVCGLLPLAVLALPLFVGAAHVWPWVDQPAQTSYLTLPFFFVRAILYLAIFVTAGEVLRRRSLRRDRAPGPLDVDRALSSALMPILALAITFAAFDWLMSLQPTWWSSAFGLYVLCGALRAGLAVVVFLAWRGVARRCMPLTPAHFHALGRVLHAFVILWAYIAYFQAMLIQIADIPSEAQFYVQRSTDGWRFVTALLVVLAFALPFPLLVPRRLKRRPAYLGAIAILLIAGHYIDMWWLVIPHVSATPLPSWTDAAALLGVAGLTVAICAWRMRGVPLLPIGDPYLAEGLAYETTT